MTWIKALKGRHIKAHGNALGTGLRENFALKGHFIFCILFILLFVGCQQTPNQFGSNHDNGKNPPASIVLPGDDQILATVNGSPITQYDLDYATSKLLNKRKITDLKDSVKKEILVSLVKNKAMAQEQQKKISLEEQAELERQVAIYQEELLAKKYLTQSLNKSNDTTKPVAQKMINDYYHNHLDQYGQKKIKFYEMIFAQKKLSETKLEAFLKRLKNDPHMQAPNTNQAQKMDWQRWHQILNNNGFPLSYQTGQVDDTVLTPQLKALFKSLTQKQKGQLVYIDDKPYVLRITKEVIQKARPLAQVSHEIREKLAPVRLKARIQKAAQKALAKAEVKYMDGG